MGDFGPAVHALVLLLVGENREDEVARLALALPHQEAAGFALLREQLFGISPGQVPVVPPGEQRRRLYGLGPAVLLCLFRSTFASF